LELTELIKDYIATELLSSTELDFLEAELWETIQHISEINTLTMAPKDICNKLELKEEKVDPNVEKANVSMNDTKSDSKVVVKQPPANESSHQQTVQSQISSNKSLESHKDQSQTTPMLIEKDVALEENKRKLELEESSKQDTELLAKLQTAQENLERCNNAQKSANSALTKNQENLIKCLESYDLDTIKNILNENKQLNMKIQDLERCMSNSLRSFDHSTNQKKMSEKNIELQNMKIKLDLKDKEIDEIKKSMLQKLRELTQELVSKREYTQEPMKDWEKKIIKEKDVQIKLLRSKEKELFKKLEQKEIEYVKCERQLKEAQETNEAEKIKIKTIIQEKHLEIQTLKEETDRITKAWKTQIKMVETLKSEIQSKNDTIMQIKFERMKNKENVGSSKENQNETINSDKCKNLEENLGKCKLSDDVIVNNC